MVKGADSLAGGLYPQAVCQVEGLNGVIESGGAIVGSTRSVGQGARVDSGLRSIVVDVGSKGSLLGIPAASASLLATAVCVTSLSLGRCQVRVYSGRGSGQVRTKTDERREQRAGQEISPAGVGDRLDSTTKDNER